MHIFIQISSATVRSLRIEDGIHHSQTDTYAIDLTVIFQVNLGWPVAL